MRKKYSVMSKINLLIFISFFTLAGFNTANAVNKTFTGPGNFSDGTRWSGGTLPLAADVLRINGACTIDNAMNNLAYGTLEISFGTLGSSIVWPSGGTATLSVTSVITGTAGAGTIDMTNGGTLQIRTSWTSTNTSLTRGIGTVNYSGAAQTVYGTNYYNLTLSGSGTDVLQAGTTSIDGNFIISGTVTVATMIGLSVTGNLSVGSGCFLTMGNFAFSVTGTTSISGTINTGTGGTGTRTFTGAVTINAGGTWTLAAWNPSTSFAGGITMNGTTFNNGNGAAAFSASQALAGTVNMTFGGNVTPAAGTTLTNNNSATVSIAGTLTLSGNYTQGSNSTTALSNNTPTNGSGTLDATTNTPNTVIYTGAAQPVAGVNYYHLVLSGSNAKTLATGTTNIAGNLTLSTTATATTVVGLTIGGTLNVQNGTTLTVAGFDFTVSGSTTVGGGTSGTLSFSSTSGVKTFSGNVTINTSASWSNSGNSAITFGGSLTCTGTFTGGTGVNTFTGTGKTISGTLSIPSATINGTVQNNGTLSITTALDGSGTLTNGAAGTLNLNFTGTPGISSLDASAAGNTVNYIYAGSQNVLATSYANLGISGGGSSVKTLLGNIIVSGTLTNAASTSLSYGTGSARTITITGTGTNTLVNSGTIDMSGGNLAHLLQIAASSIASFGTLTNGTVGTANTVEYNASGAQAMNVVTYRSLLLSGSGAKTGAVTTVNGNLTLSGTATMTTSATFSIGGNLDVGSGTSLTMGNFALTVTGTTSISGTINTATGGTGTRTFTGAVTVNSGGVWDLSLRNPATSFAGGITMNGTSFNNGSGAAAFSANQSLAGNIDMLFNGNVTPAASTTLTNNNAGIVTIAGTLTLTGNFTQGSNSPTLVLSNATPTSGTGTLDASTNPNTVNYSGVAQACQVTTYRNLTLSGSLAKTFATTPTVNGVLSLEGTASVAVTTGVVTYGTNATLQYNKAGTYTATSKEWITPFTASGGIKITNTGAITTPGAVTIGDNTNYAPLTIDPGATLTPGANLITVYGDFINNGTLTSGTGGMTITGTKTSQSISGFTTSGTITMSKASGTATFTGNIIGNALTISGTTGVLNLGSSLTHSFSGNITLTSGSLNGGSSTLNENNTNVNAWNGTGSVFTAGTGTVVFGGGNQTLSASATTFNNLQFAGTGTKILSSATSINGNFSLNSGVNTDLGTSTAHTAGTLTLGGVQQSNGYWGGTSSGATHTNTTYFATNTGKINVTTCNSGVWSGSVSNDWATAGNWCNNQVPNSSVDVVVYSGGNQPQINSSALCNSLTLYRDASLTINGSNSLSVTTTVTLNSPSTSATLLDVGAGTLNTASISIPGSSTGSRYATVSVSTGTVNVSGNVSFSGTAAQARFVFTGTATLNIGGNFGSGGTLTTVAGSIINFNGTSAQTAGIYTTYNVLKSNNTAGVTLLGVSTIATLTIGDVTANSLFSDGGYQVSSTGTLNLVSGTFKLGGLITATTWPSFATNNISTGTTVEYASTASQTISISPSYQNLTLSGASTKTPAAGTLTIGGNLLISAGTLALNTNNNVVNLGGNLTNNGTITPGTSSNLTLNGLSNQSISGTTTPTTLGSLTLAKSGTATLGVNVTLTANLSVIAGTLDLSSYTANRTAAGGTLTVSNGAILIIGGTNTMPSSYSTHTFGSNTSTINYNGTTQTISSETYAGNLILSGGAKTLQAGTTAIGGNFTINNATATTVANLTISGNLIIGDGTTLTLGGFTFNVNGTTTIGNGTSGTITMSSATGTKTFSGNFTINTRGIFTENGYAATLAFGSNVVINRGGSLTESGAAVVGIAGNFTNNEIYTASTGIHTFSGTGKTINGSNILIQLVTITGTYTNNSILTITSALAGAGGLTNGTSGVLNLNLSLALGITTVNFSTTGNTVNYGYGGAQPVRATPYYNLIISGTTGGVKDLSGVTTINNDFTISGLASASTAATMTVGRDMILGVSGALTTGAGLTITRNLIIGDGTTFTAAGFALSVGGNLTVGNGGSGTFTISSATGAKTISGDVTINTGGTWNNTAGNQALNFLGNLSCTGTFNSGTGRQKFSGTSKTISGTLTIRSANINGTIQNNATLTVSDTLSGTGTLTNGSSGILNINFTGSIGLGNLVATATGNTVIYSFAGTQNVKNTTYYNLVLATSGAKTFQGITTVNGELWIKTATATLNGYNSSATTLTLNDAGTVTGTWGGTGSGAGHINAAFTAGTGMVTVNSASDGTWIGNTTAWETPTNWAGGVVPNANMNVIIPNVTNKPVINSTAYCRNITINASSSLTISGTNSLTVSGDWANSGTLTASAGSTVIFNGAAQTINTGSFSNLTLKGSGVKTNTAVTITGVLSLEETATLSAAPTYGTAATLQYNTSTPRTCGLEWITPFVATGGVIISGTGMITMDAAKVFGNGTTKVPLTINSGATLKTYSFALTFYGDFNNSGLVIPMNSVLNISGTYSQNIGAFRTVFGSININKTAGTVTLMGDVYGGTGGISLSGSNNMTVDLNGHILSTSGTLSIPAPTSAPIVLNIGTGTVSVFTLALGATTGANLYNDVNISTGTLTASVNITAAGVNSRIIVTGTGVINTAGTFLSGGTFTAGSGTVNYNLDGSQTATQFTYNNLTLSGTSGTNVKTFANAPTVNGILSMEGNATMTITSGTLVYGSNATLKYNTATSRTSSTSEWITPFAATGGVIIANTGTITLNGAKTFNASIPLTINSGSTLDLSSYLLTLSGDLLNSGGNVTGTTGGVTITGTATQSIGAFTTTGTVSMLKPSGTATFTGNINGGPLTINGGGTLDLGSGLTHTFSGAWTRTNGTVLGNSSSLNIGGNVTNTAGIFTAGTGTVNYNGSGSQILATVTYNNLGLSGSGSKTFGGATTINGELAISSPAQADLTALTSSTTATLKFEEDGQASGSWGSTSSSATFKNNTYFTSTTGIVSVSSCTTGLWTGATSTDWNTNSNWCSSTKPTSLIDVIIPSTAPNQPVIGAVGGSCKSLTINSGASLQISSNYTLSVDGSWINNGTFTANNSTVTINGSSPATIGGSSSTTFNNLTINNSAGLTLGVNANVNGVLTYSTGKITTTPSYNITLGSSASVSGAGIGKYVNGLLKWVMNSGAQTKVFDVGDASNYTPMTVQFTALTSGGTLTGSTTTGDHPNNVVVYNSRSVNRYWTLTSTGLSGITANVTFNWVSGDLDAGARTYAFIVAQNLGSSWILPDLANSTSTSIQATSLDAFGDFQVGENCPWVFPGWTARKSHLINQTAGAGTNYPVKITVHYGSGTDNAGDVYCGTSCQTDFGDIRFATPDSVVIGFWLESKVDGDNAIFWVKIPGNLSDSSKTIYMYYGKTCGSATTTSSTGGAFASADDGVSLNQWTQVDAVNTGYTMIDGISCYFANTKNGAASGAGGQYYLFRRFAGMGPGSFTFFNVRTQTGNLGNIYFMCDTNGRGQMYRIEARSATSSGFATTSDWNTWTAPTGGPTALPNTWYKFGIKINSAGTQATLYWDQGYSTDPEPGTPITGTSTFAVSNNGEFMGLGGDAVGGGPLYTYWDNFVTRKYIETEPTQGGWGTQQLAYVFNGSGSWQTGTNWTPSRISPVKSDILQFTCGGTETSNNVPDETVRQVIVANGTLVNLQPSAGIKTLSVSGTLSIDATSSLNFSNNVLLSGSLSTIMNAGTIYTAVPTSTSTLPIPANRTWGGTVNYNAASGSQTVVTGTYNTLTMGNTSGTQTAAGTLTATTLNNITGGTLDMGANTLTATTVNNTNSTIKFSGLSNGFAVGTGTIDYTGGTQNVGSGTYYNLVTSGAGNKTASGSITATTLDNGGSSNAAVVLDMGNNTLSAGSIENTNSTIKFNGVSNGVAVSTGTIEYTASGGGQTVATGTYNNLMLDNTGNTNTANGNLTSTGTFTTTAGGTLDMGTSSTLSVSTVSSAGIIKTAVPTGTSSTPITAGKTWGGTVEYSASAGSQTAVGGTFNNLSFDNTSGTNSASGTLTVNGTLTTTANGTLNMGTNPIAGTPSSINSNGIIRTAYASGLPIPDGYSWGGSVIYEGASAQSLSGGTFNNMTLNNASGGTLNNNVTVNGTFTLTAGAVSLNSKTFAYGSSGTLLYNGSTAQTSALEFPSANGPRNLTVSNTAGVTYGLDSRTLAGDLTVNAGSAFNVNEGSALFVNGTTTNNSTTANLLIKSSATGTGCLCTQNAINATVNRYVTGTTTPYPGSTNLYPYHFISAPINNATLSNIWQSGDYNVYWYDETVLHGNLDHGWTRFINGNMTPGRGYATVSNFTNRTLTLPGSLNYPPVSIPVTRTVTNPVTYPWIYGMDPQGWNLVGNPFACAISVSAFLSDNTASLASSAVYSWDDNNGDTNRWSDYNTHNGSTGVAATQHPGAVPNGKIAVGQGFFIKVNSSATSAIFNGSQRVANSSSQYFIPDPKTISTFRFSINGDSGLYNQAVLTFLPEATDGYDFAYDALKLKGNPTIALYSLINGEKYVIQGLSPVTAAKVVPIGLDYSKSGSLTFKAEEIENFPSNIYIILEDKLTNTFTNLLNQKEYTFNTGSGEIANRFVLHFSLDPNSIEKIKNAPKSFTIYSVGNTINISSALPFSGKAYVTVTNMYGQVVAEKQLENINSNSITINSESGYYLVTVRDNNGISSQKVLIK